MDTFEGNTQFEEFRDDFGEVLEEFVVVFGIGFDPFLHDFVLTHQLLNRERERKRDVVCT